MLDFHDFIAIISYSSSLHLPPHTHSLSPFSVIPKFFLLNFWPSCFSLLGNPLKVSGKAVLKWVERRQGCG